MNAESSPKPRDMSIANLVNVPLGRSHGGPTPYSLDPIVGPSRLVPITSPHNLPYPLAASSSTGTSSLHHYGSEVYADADDYSDSEGESVESAGDSQEMNDVDPQPDEAHRSSGEGSIVTSSLVSPLHDNSG